MINDYEFLSALDRQPNKVIYVELVSLNYNEQPIEAIQGRATAGSINIDGASAVRRTCQISLVTDTLNISNYYWSLKTKFKVRVGVENNITNSPDIIWFDQGVFVISSFSTSYSSNNYTVNISGKDKMCMLNGEMGGIINASTVFDTYNQIDKNGNKRTIKNPIKTIIRDMVHQYGGEPLHNIIINDLDMTGLELLEYRFEQPLFLLREGNDLNYTQATLQPIELDTYDSVDLNGNLIPSSLYIQDDIEYHVAKIEFGETAGYHEIDMVYPTELIASIGETVVSVLDKIKNTLGDYEYFYDIDGHFIFQQKKTYLNTAWSPSIKNEGEQVYVDPYFTSTPYSYSFTDSALFTTFNNTPDLSNLKNDFTVWGTNKKNLQIHMRYAIDRKPNYYKSIHVDFGTVNSDGEFQQGADFELINQYNKKFDLSIGGQDSITYWYNDGTDKPDEHCVICADWREIIYQMQKDYYKYNFLDNFNLKIAAANPLHYPSGITGYEQYYIDIQGFWRYLYTPPAELAENNSEYYHENEEHAGWRKIVYEAPNELLFWFDFLDTQTSELAQYSVPAIGIRPKVTNDDAVKAIYYGDTPSIIFGDLNEAPSERKSGYRYFNEPKWFNMFTRSTQGKSAKNAIDNLMYNHSYCIESVSIQSVPIYYLHPNTLIYINDINANIIGEYIISKMTIPLTYNGTMNITATKVVPRLY